MRYRLYYLVGKLSNAILIPIRYEQVGCFVVFLKYDDMVNSLNCVTGLILLYQLVVLVHIYRKLFRGFLGRYIIIKFDKIC